MSATAAGESARRGGAAARRWAVPTAAGHQAGQVGPGQRVVRAGPERRVRTAAPRQRTGPAAPGRRVVARPGQRADAVPVQQAVAAPERSAGPAMPEQQRRVPAHGQRPIGTPGQRLLGERRVPAPGQRTAWVAERGVAGERRGRPEAKPRPPTLVLVPPLRTVPDERPEVPEPATGTEERARRPVRQAPARPARGPGARTRPRTRLTRRGRIVVSMLVMAVMLLVAALAWVAGATRADATGSGGPPPSAVYRNLRPVIVQPGESLWAIAVQAEPNADPRAVIQQIIDLNALGGASIQPGERLWVPRG